MLKCVALDLLRAKATLSILARSSESSFVRVGPTAGLTPFTRDGATFNVTGTAGAGVGGTLTGCGEREGDEAGPAQSWPVLSPSSPSITTSGQLAFESVH